MRIASGSMRAYVSHPPPLPRLPLLPSGLRMLHPPIEQLELGPGRPEEHRDEQEGECARITELQQLPADPVDARHDHVRRAERPPARQHHDEREHLEGADY